jgi:ribosomal protein L3 glutamine methyltransferase
LTLQQLIDKTAKRFKAARLHYGHGTDNAQDEAAFLVLRGLGLPFDAPLSRPADPRRIERLVRRRIAERLPAAYLLNEAWLDGERFYIDRRVIVPRSHIAFLLRELRIRPRRVLDLCTGSGCLAILAARAFPGAEIDGSDISAAALAVAARNVRLHKLGRRVRLVRSDLFENLAGRYDLIVSNPPYVSTPAMRRLPLEFRHEPGLALGGGRHGLDLVARILAGAAEHLAARGILVCEVGDGRRALERAYPRLPLVWPRDEVFILERAKMDGVAQIASRRDAASSGAEPHPRRARQACGRR